MICDLDNWHALSVHPDTLLSSKVKSQSSWSEEVASGRCYLEWGLSSRIVHRLTQWKDVLDAISFHSQAIHSTAWWNEVHAAA